MPTTLTTTPVILIAVKLLNNEVALFLFSISIPSLLHVTGLLPRPSFEVEGLKESVRKRPLPGAVFQQRIKFWLSFKEGNVKENSVKNFLPNLVPVMGWADQQMMPFRKYALTEAIEMEIAKQRLRTTRH